MVRTMLRRDGNAEKFWFVARPCATGKQLAAVSDICTGSPFVDSSAPVHVVPFPAVEHFLTARSYAFVAQHFLNDSGRWRHLNTTQALVKGRGLRKSKVLHARQNDDMMHFTVKDNANVDAPTRICSARMENNFSTRILL